MSRRAARHPRSSRAASGALLVDKPAGPSSFAVVRQIRKRLGGKVGHAGTLDPLASGLLVVLVGPATRLARYLVGLDKRYVTEVELGLRTTTGDAEGDELERPPVPDDLAARLGRAHRARSSCPCRPPRRSRWEGSARIACTAAESPSRCRSG